MTKKSIQKLSVAESLFTSRARLAVLKLLYLSVGQRFYVREVAARTGLPVRAVQRELARLESSGLLTASLEGNRKYYTANPKAPVYSELRTLLLKTVGLGDLLADHLRSASGEIDLAFVYGSLARGEDRPESDIDLLVVGSISGRGLAKVLQPAREELGREINPFILTHGEYRARLEQQDHFLGTVLAEPKILLVGGPDDIERLAKTRPAAAPQD